MAHRLPLALLLILLCFLTSFSGCRTGTAVQKPEEDDVLRFMVVGDWGMGLMSQQRTVANQMAKTAQEHPIDFIISTGDNFYNSGVQSVNDPLWKQRYEKVYNQPSLRVPWYVVLGNHDYGGNVQAQLDYHRKNPRWNLPTRYYARSFRLNDTTQADFFFLDTFPIEMHAQEKTAQLRWLDSALAASAADWKIVVGHHAIHTAGLRMGNTRTFIQELEPILVRHRIHAYFCGHEHDLQHLQTKGIDHFISGAGAEARAVNVSDYSRFVRSTTGFMLAELGPEQLQVRIIDSRGRNIYSYSISR